MASQLQEVFVTCFPEKLERGNLKEMALMLFFIPHHLQSYADLFSRFKSLWTGKESNNKPLSAALESAIT